MWVVFVSFISAIGCALGTSADYDIYDIAPAKTHSPVVGKFSSKVKSTGTSFDAEIATLEDASLFEFFPTGDKSCGKMVVVARVIFLTQSATPRLRSRLLWLQRRMTVFLLQTEDTST